jgi:catechol 2,3-dioxygenase-like lactoylglutathione lyase family enzyme
MDLTDRVKSLGRPHGLPFRIGKLGHVVLNVRDVERSARFYTEVLGFEISDVYPEAMVPGGMVFLRCNPDHHGIALVGSMTTEAANVELNHLAFEVATLGRPRATICDGTGSRSISPAAAAPDANSRSNSATRTTTGWRSTGASIRSAAKGMSARRPNGRACRASKRP